VYLCGCSLPGRYCDAASDAAVLLLSFWQRLAIPLQPGSPPAWGPVCRMSPTERAEVRQELLSNGWIRPSESEFGKHILFVRKKDGSLRVCVAFRRLNAITVKTCAPLPRIEELYDTQQGAMVFSKLELDQGYHQMRVAEQDVHKLACSGGWLCHHSCVARAEQRLCCHATVEMNVNGVCGSGLVWVRQDPGCQSACQLQADLVADPLDPLPR
jgi:hypothetical protein